MTTKKKSCSSLSLTGTLVIFLLLSTALFSCKSKNPTITSIDPKIGRMGEVITLTGNNFGASQEESYVTIAGIAPTGSSYYLWQDNLIIVRIPELGESGLVFVHVNGKKSNGVLFSNSVSVPRPMEGEVLGLEPRIISVSPQAGAPGTLITITGNNFGVSREGFQYNTGVFFSWNYTSPTINPFAVKEPEFIEVSEQDLGYASWNTREIRVYVPDGAVSGNLEVRTPHGKSRPYLFDVSGKPGNKIFTDKRAYTINYSVDIRVLEASRSNSLYLWIPNPASSSSQRNVTLISRNADPVAENHRGVSLFKLDNLSAGSITSINLSFHVETYAVETDLSPLNVKQETSALSAMYTQSSNLIRSEDPLLKATVSTITGREQNPYLKARLLYDWIISDIHITEALHYPADSIAYVIEQKRADSYSAALLYAAMARAASLPCIPVAGVLVDRSGQTVRHYWTEIWFDGFGWLPVDPVLGAGAVPASFIIKEDLQDYYFGNSDSRRIAFSRGEIMLSQMENRGRTVSHSRSYSLQNIWEEAAGGLESYTSLWGDIVISGIYVQ